MNEDEEFLFYLKPEGKVTLTKHPTEFAFALSQLLILAILGGSSESMGMNVQIPAGIVDRFGREVEDSSGPDGLVVSER